MIAQSVGLSIPPSTTIVEKKDLVAFMTGNEKIITKGIQEVITFKSGDKRFCNYTERFKEENLSQITSRFSPSFFQKMIEKDIEIRVFYLDGVCYSTALFSQEIEQTAVDYRKYSSNTPTRSVPYQLPHKVERNICSFMQTAGYKTGSIDLIKAKDGEYYFLEVNPVGQYGGLSIECHYHLNKHIAAFLAKKTVT